MRLRGVEGGSEIGEMGAAKAIIRMEFFRHDEKAKPAEGQPDTTVRLTPKGRIDATEAGKQKNPHSEVAVAFGSSRERSVETAARHMFANEESVGPDVTLEDIRDVVAGEVKVGRKDMISPNLNFTYEDSAEYKAAFLQAYTKDKRGLEFMLKESDALVQQLGDKTDSSYTRQAANIAELVQKYWDILPNWQRVAQEHPEKYAQYNNEMQRFMGSHQTVTESFLMKVIDKTEGPQAVVDFIQGMPDKNGFGFSEGFQVQITGNESGSQVVLTYKDRQWPLTREMLEEIVEERRVLDSTITDKK